MTTSKLLTYNVEPFTPILSPKFGTDDQFPPVCIGLIEPRQYCSIHKDPFTVHPLDAMGAFFSEHIFGRLEYK